MRRSYLIIFFIWLMALLIRWPHLNRPLSKHHEFNPAIVLICLETWNLNGGPLYSGYCPVFNYTNPGDLYLDQGRDLVLDHQGNQVYVSFGSGYFLYPYWFIKAIQFPFTALSVRVFTLLLGLISMVLMFHIMRNSFSQHKDKRNRLALLGIILFSFNPGFLWYFSNGYDHEIVTIPFFLGTVLLFQTFHQQPIISWRSIMVLSILLIGGIFCDWLNFFTAAYIFVYSLYAGKKDKKWKKLLIPVSIAVILSTFFCAYPFVKYLGAEAYFEMLSTRFSERSILSSESEGFILHLKKLVFNYGTAYGPLLITFVFLLLIVRISLKSLMVEINKIDKASILLLAVVPFVHHFIFLEFSGRHEYSVIKTLPFLTLVIAFLFLYSRTKFVPAIIIFFVIAGVLQFYFINRPGNTSWKGENYNISEKTGELVKLNAQPDEVVFVMDNDMYPQMNFYAKRSTINAGSLIEAKQKLRTKTRSKKGVWLNINKGKLLGVYHFTLNDLPL